MKKTIKLLFVITFIFLLAATLCSCSKGELNGRYESKNNDGTVFYFYDNNEVHTSVMKYDAMYDMYVATWYGGEYKIFEDPQNLGSLLIEFNMSNQGTYTYNFKETENGIIIDGEEFALASQYPNNFWILNCFVVPSKRTHDTISFSLIVPDFNLPIPILPT